MTDKPRVFHQCPNCGYVVDDLQFRYARFDYPCPRCEVKTLSSFAVRTPEEPAQDPTNPPVMPYNTLISNQTDD